MSIRRLLGMYVKEVWRRMSVRVRLYEVRLYSSRFWGGPRMGQGGREGVSTCGVTNWCTVHAAQRSRGVTRYSVFAYYCTPWYSVLDYNVFSGDTPTPNVS